MLFNSYYTKTKNSLTKTIACCILLSTACLTMQANAETEAKPEAKPEIEAWRDTLPQAQVIGSGELRWFGLRIYSATLWSEQQPFNVNAPFALQLTYHRSISRAQFVQTSLDEIKRLFGKRYNAETLKRWEGEMNRAFSDVHANDRLIGVFVPHEGCRFYNSSQLLADIRDPEFASAFFAIWFDVRTKNKALYTQLQGKAS